jgi:hypothetical protein
MQVAHGLPNVGMLTLPQPYGKLDVARQEPKSLPQLSYQLRLIRSERYDRATSESRPGP